MRRDTRRSPAEPERRARERLCALAERSPRSRGWSYQSAKNVWWEAGSSTLLKQPGRDGLRTSGPATFRCSPKGGWAADRGALCEGTPASVRKLLLLKPAPVG